MKLDVPHRLNGTELPDSEIEGKNYFTEKPKKSAEIHEVRPKANCPIISSGCVGKGSGNANPLPSSTRQYMCDRHDRIFYKTHHVNSFYSKCFSRDASTFRM